VKREAIGKPACRAPGELKGALNLKSEILSWLRQMKIPDWIAPDL
jgi:hypothetical protein